MTIYHDLPADSAMPDTPQRILLADVRSDIAAIFGAPHGGGMTAAPLTTGRRALRSGARVPAATRKASAAPVALAAGMAGLLAGMAVIGAHPLLDRIDGPAASTQHGTPLAVTESPFEKAGPAAAEKRAPPAPAPAAELTTVKAAQPVELTAVTEPVRTNPVKAAEAPGKAAQPESPTQCEGDRLERQWCMRHDILEADRRLRRAYAAAIHEGVERRFLVAHQQRWTRLRSRASTDPEGVLEGYGELAAALERLSVNGRRRDRIS